MFNEKFLTVLGQINNMTNTVILKYPLTVTESEGKEIRIRWDVSKLDNTEFPDVPLFNCLDKFLNSVRLFKEPVYNFVDNSVQIKDNNAEAEFILSNRALMSDYDKDDKQFKLTDEVPTVCEFDLTVQDISALKSAGNVFKDLEFVVISAKDSSMKLSLGNSSRFNSHSNSYSIKKDVTTEKEFSIAIPVKNFFRVPVSEYKVEVKYNSQRDSYRVVLRNKSIDGLDIILSIKSPKLNKA